MRRRAQLLMALVGCLGALGIAASASASASTAQRRPTAIVRVDAAAQPHTAVAVTKFLLHAGVAYYVFDHYIWKPYKAGDLHGFTHAFTIAKALLAAVVVYHEAQEMAGDVKGSKLLSFLTAPIAAVVTKLDSLKSDISGGNSGALSTINGGLSSIESQAGAKGVVIKQITQSV
jgi:hypothetical protein